tara:strand:- start:1261 stop:1419 length:159 start_codon:yes stop_codon:yes gene_type:complete
MELLNKDYFENCEVELFVCREIYRLNNKKMPTYPNLEVKGLQALKIFKIGLR